MAESPNPKEKLEKRFEAHRGQEANPEAAAGEEELREKGQEEPREKGQEEPREKEGEDTSQPTMNDAKKDKTRRKPRPKVDRLAPQNLELVQGRVAPGGWFATLKELKGAVNKVGGSSCNRLRCRVHYNDDSKGGRIAERGVFTCWGPKCHASNEVAVSVTDKRHMPAYASPRC